MHYFSHGICPACFYGHYQNVYNWPFVNFDFEKRQYPKPIRLLMSYQFCTITTMSHLYKVYALTESLKNQGHSFVLNTLVIDDDRDFSFENCKFFKLSDISGRRNAGEIIAKYKGNKDKLRWSLKPVLMRYLLSLMPVDRLIYLDNDLFFFSDYEFLFELLEHHSFILTPHYYKNDPNNNQNWLEANFRIGLYNAGFVGANKQALKTLQWWADCCLYRCEKNSLRGMFDDQKYLDIIPIIEESACIIRHKGCNVAGWNTEICSRKIVDNRIRIDGKFDIIFIHFNENTIREIVRGSDFILFNYYRAYIETLKRFRRDLKKQEIYFDRRFTDRLKLRLWKILTQLEI